MISPKLALCSLVTGIITGAVCSFFETIPVALSESRLAFLGSITWGPVAVFLMAFLMSGALAAFAMYLTRRFAPEAGGSGIPEIEGAMVDLRPVRFWRVLPVKFFGGIMSLSSGMILGREGPWDGCPRIQHRRPEYLLGVPHAAGLREMQSSRQAGGGGTRVPRQSWVAAPEPAERRGSK
jgi:hypothetical protein